MEEVTTSIWNATGAIPGLSLCFHVALNIFDDVGLLCRIEDDGVDCTSEKESMMLA